MTTTNPKTGRKILIGGPTYNRLIQSSKWGPMLDSNREYFGTSKEYYGSTKKEYYHGKEYYSPSPRSTSKSRGCSNQRKYIHSGIPEEDFCGPEGGSCRYTYPVNTPGRARAALSYARHAPDPEGIRECALRKAREKGWVGSSGRISVSKKGK